VGLFNTTDSDAIEAAITAAEAVRSPIIIGTAEVLLPHGDLPLLAPTMVHMAKCANVPVVVHFDHGLTVERCKQAIDLGFSSIMFDGSAGDPDENLNNTRQMVQFAHNLGISVEGEIGHVGEVITGDQDAQDMYTTPEEAIAFVEATGVDALAIAIGTAHGAYKTKPKLDIQRLKQIRSVLDTPLVLHGASGLSREDLHSTIREGVTKMNIFTDLYAAGLQVMLQGGEDYHEIRNRKVAAIRQVVMEKMELFGSVGRC
jgi:fructose-bisphosphate aldolase class II